jgi:hypothetical protein
MLKLEAELLHFTFYIHHFIFKCKMMNVEY